MLTRVLAPASLARRQLRTTEGGTLGPVFDPDQLTTEETSA